MIFDYYFKKGTNNSGGHAVFVLSHSGPIYVNAINSFYLNVLCGYYACDQKLFITFSENGTLLRLAVFVYQ